MNKKEFISFITKNENITRVEAEKIIDVFTRSVTKALGSSKEVQLIGFGNFAVSDIKARNGRNPRTGEVMKIPAYRQPKFKAGQKLKDACN
ncbi:MAG: HU family DNA-binding protein [Rickettsiaceae bacterium]|nr:HU family DNA-binding protein [Rickettsiaceae bacterium]